MSKSANVRSIQALKDFRNAFCNFAEDARGALGAVEMEVRKFRDWLERDQMNYWRMQVKKRQDDLIDARAELHKKKLAAGKSDAVSDSEQKENLRNATRRLRAAEEKVETIKKLIPQFHHAVAEYHSHSQPLSDHMSGGFERSLARLTAMIDALEGYIALQAPVIAPLAANGSTSSASAPKMTTSVSSRAANSNVDDPLPESVSVEPVAVGAVDPSSSQEILP